jgi:Transposase IS4
MNQFNNSSIEYGDNDVFSNISAYGELINQSVNNIEISVDDTFENIEDFQNDCDSDDDLLLFDNVHKFANNSVLNHNDSDSGSDIEVRPSKRRRYVFTESDSEDENGSSTNSANWSILSNNIFQPKNFNFSIGGRRVGPNIPSNCDEPLDYFKLFFTDELISSIVDNTNKYANNAIKKTQLTKNSLWNSWRDVNEEEFRAFLGVILNMGVRPHPNLQDYFSTSFTAYTPFFRSVFKRDRFLQIFWMLHLKTNEADENQTLERRVEKVNGFMQHLDIKFREHMIPRKQIVVDESVVNFKGRVCFMTYNPNKPNKWGIRIYILADSGSGYIYSFVPYYGSLTTNNLIRPDLTFTSRIVLHLYNNLLISIPGAEGYHMFTDRLYTNLQLGEEFLKLKAHLTGTIMMNRKNIPLSIKNAKVKPGETIACVKNNQLLLAWKDKRIVTMYTNFYSNDNKIVKRIIRGGEEEIIAKPDMVINYTKYMGGVDTADQYTAAYPFLRKTLKWWRKLFFWGLEVSVVNSYILYKEKQRGLNKKAMSHLEFVDKLIIQLVGNHRGGLNHTKGRHSLDPELRLNGKLHVLMPQEEKKSRECIVCSDKIQRKRTIYLCITCDIKPAMCVGVCFQKYHTLKIYR